jgi:tRNA (guanine-N7-)-methyltransferase
MENRAPMKVDPYAHAPRLVEGEDLDPLTFFEAYRPGQAGPVAVEEPATLELEIGPGRGWFTLERIDADPSVRVLGFEVRKKWATIVDDRLKKRGYGHRGRVFAEDIKVALPRLRDASFSRVYLHFPDPWWKKRHEKRLVMGADLLEILSRKMIPGGELFVQTDVMERADQYEQVVLACPAFEPLLKTVRVDDHPFVARSPRERQAIEDGLPVVRLRFRCRGPLAPSPANATET